MYMYHAMSLGVLPIYGTLFNISQCFNVPREVLKTMDFAKLP